MLTTAIDIQTIPAVVWGPPSNHVFIAVHGNMSSKTDTVIRLLAQEAISKGYQVLSFDLPEHGDRKGQQPLCKIENCIRDLGVVLAYAQRKWLHLSLFACSMGAYFSLIACNDKPLQQCLFLSPVVDMKKLVENMFVWFNIDRQQLQQKKEITAPDSTKMYWDDYLYLKKHPVARWDTPTWILYGENDQLSEGAVVQAFCQQFCAKMQVHSGGEHFFHTPEQLAFYSDWLKRCILPALDDMQS